MTQLTLLTKIYNSHQVGQLDAILQGFSEGLDVKTFFAGILAGKWVLVEVSGEDEAVVTKLLERDIGFCPIHFANVKKFSALKGFVTGFKQSEQELQIDVGVVRPALVSASIPLKRLQANFADGREVSLQHISELWGFCENLPLCLKVLNVNVDKNSIECEFEDAQIRKLQSWKQSLLDRLLVIGASKIEVDAAVEQAGLRRDIIEVEPLGIFEHALVCKLGTDAAGMIGIIGRRMRKAKFVVFNPKRIYQEARSL